MLIQFFFFCILLSILFFLSRKIHTAIYTTVYIFSGNQKLALIILLLILFPGTIIHELSHFFIATILHVPTGELSILPTIEKSGEVRAGKLMIGRVDPFRQTFVGLAPIFIGLGILFAVGVLFSSQLTTYSTSTPLSASLQLTTIFYLYLFFVTSITMFSSKKDVENLIIVGPLAFLVIASLYKVGVRIILDEPLITNLELILRILTTSLTITAILDGTIFTILFLLEKLGEKLLRARPSR